MNKPVLSCTHLSKTFVDGATKITVLNNISFEVMPSQSVSIIGASGSGKSTLLHLLGGLDKPSQGEVILSGKNIHQLNETEKCALRNQTLGFIYQFHHLLPEFSALENTAMPLLVSGKPKSVIRERAEYLLGEVGLKNRIHHRLGQLSGGERQRVAIARALVNNPLCILADEPTGNLDPANAERVLQLFLDLQNTNKTSVVIVTHDPLIAQSTQAVKKIESCGLIEIKNTADVI